MSKKRKRTDGSRQDSFNFIPIFDPKVIKRGLRVAIKASPLSRQQIVDRASVFLGKQITGAQLDAWTADSKPDHLPRIDAFAALVFATGQPDALDAVAAFAGLAVIGQADQQLLEIAKLEEERDAIEQRLALLKLATVFPVDLQAQWAECAKLQKQLAVISQRWPELYHAKIARRGGK